MSFLSDVFEKARAKPGRIVFPESDDPRIVEAAGRIAADGMGVPVLIGLQGPPPAGVETVDPEEADTEALVAAILANRPQMRRGVAERMLRKPLYLAAALVASGKGDALVAGANTPTRRVIEAAGLVIGMEKGVGSPSSFFIMLTDDRPPLFFADCALNVAPDSATLADIAVATGRSAAALTGLSPRVAMLSFSTHASGAGPSVERVREAAALAKGIAPDLAIDGPLQADAALSGAVAAKKGAGGDVAGAANVLIFPDLDSGNIAYKLVQTLAGAQAVGPFLQGFARPVCDLSRGATVTDIVAAAAIARVIGRP